MKLSEIKAKFPNRRIGFKATNQDMKCLGYQYELNKLYRHKGKVIPCDQGYHFCKNLINTLFYYENIKGDKRFFIVEYGKNFIEHGDKVVSDEITFLEEIDIMEYIKDNHERFSLEKWYGISYRQKLSEDFIREHQDKLYWSGISCYQKLSEDFIIEFADKVDWDGISHYQKLSEEFKEEFKDRL